MNERCLFYHQIHVLFGLVLILYIVIHWLLVFPAHHLQQHFMWYYRGIVQCLESYAIHRAEKKQIGEGMKRADRKDCARIPSAIERVEDYETTKRGKRTRNEQKVRRRREEAKRKT